MPRTRGTEVVDPFEVAPGRMADGKVREAVEAGRLALETGRIGGRIDEGVNRCELATDAGGLDERPLGLFEAADTVEGFLRGDTPRDEDTEVVRPFKRGRVELLAVDWDRTDGLTRGSCSSAYGPVSGSSSMLFCSISLSTAIVGSSKLDMGSSSGSLGVYLSLHPGAAKLGLAMQRSLARGTESK